MNNCHYMIIRSVEQQGGVATLGELLHFFEEYARVFVSGSPDLALLSQIHQDAKSWKSLFRNVPKSSKRFLNGQILLVQAENNGLSIPVVVWLLTEMIELLETYWEEFQHDARLSVMLQDLRRYSFQIREFLP